MSLVVWVMMGIAVWHFTVFVPDRFWGGIVGAFLAAVVVAALFGFIVNGATVPGRHDTDLVQALHRDPRGADRPGALVPLGRACGPRGRRGPRLHPRRLALAGRTWPIGESLRRTGERARACGTVEVMPDPPALAPEPAVSVVVATHNRALRLARLLEGLRAPDAAGRALRGDRRGRRLRGRHAGRAGRVSATHHALRLCMPPPSGAPRPGRGAATAAGDSRGLRSWPSPTTTACPPPPGSRRSSPRQPRAGARRSSAVARCPTPPRRGSLGPFAKTVEINGPEPVLRDLQHRLPAVAPRADRRLRRVVPEPGRRGLRPGCARRGGGRRARVRAGRRWCTTPCPPAGPGRRSATRSWPRTACARTSAIPPCAGTCLCGSSTTARIRCCCWPSPGCSRAARCSPRCSASLTRGTRRGGCGLAAPARVTRASSSLFDTIQLVAAVRGALRNRTLVL